MSSCQRFSPSLIWSYYHQDIALGRKVTQSWKILDVFSWKIHIFQSKVHIFKPFWCQDGLPTLSNSCLISTVYCAKLGKKLLAFMKNIVKTLLGFQYFCDVSSVLTLILAHKLSFQREKYSQWDGLKFNTIQLLDQK